MNILHLVTHPNISASRVNKSWAEQLQKSGKIKTTRYLYNDYPDHKIDIEREQTDLLAHDRIILQFPFYWYSTPPLLKQWQDDVLTHGFAYGSKGNKLKGKELQLILSAGADAQGYMPGGYNNFTVTEFLRPLQQTAIFIGMAYLPPMWMNNSVAADDQTVRKYGQRWVDLIDDPVRGNPHAAKKHADDEITAFIEGTG